jgi:TRAP-type uncharacterized transport system fused permease subunit
VVLATVTGCLAIVALVGGVGGWIVKPATWLERAILLVAAGFLFYTGTVQDLIGLALMATGIGLHWLRIRGDDTPGAALSGTT